MPCKWDFPSVEPDKYHLPEVKIARWGGFLFINPDENAEPFEVPPKGQTTSSRTVVIE